MISKPACFFSRRALSIFAYLFVKFKAERSLNLNDLLTKFCRARAVLGNLLG
ncbi:hypothetical protein CAMRE0001_1442 [Campylobacter rectus RM3267]|uniref:Uncharacterized protein n=1 Tax=Campylobacter rectus RM3267 TaxID=553218 RepID=B9D0B9_CAMRE|nr:hypothetical protein CAMRE0001_1442 [Campylobacter rectus RM3267]